jgi:hypothetical protein
VSLTSKAKTTNDIWFGYDTCNYAEYHATQKWVPLDYAQKLESKIVEANKILDEMTDRLDKDATNLEGIRVSYVRDISKRLREVLQK